MVANSGGTGDERTKLRQLFSLWERFADCHCILRCLCLLIPNPNPSVHIRIVLDFSQLRLSVGPLNETSCDNLPLLVN